MIREILRNRVIIFLLILYIAGFIFGLYSFIKLTPQFEIYEKEITFINVISCFSKNVWYLILIYILGYSFIGIVINPIIIVGRGFIFGIIISFAFQISIGYMFLYLGLELFLIIPSLITISYMSLNISYNSLKYRSKIDYKKYNTIMFIIIIVILIYSIIVSIN